MRGAISVVQTLGLVLGPAYTFPGEVKVHP
jgi:hypothetical protein